MEKQREIEAVLSQVSTITDDDEEEEQQLLCWQLRELALSPGGLVNGTQ